MLVGEIVKGRKDEPWAIKELFGPISLKKETILIHIM